MAGVVEAGYVVGDGKLLDAGDVLGVFDGDGGVVNEDVEKGDGVVRVLVEMGIEDFEDAVGSFASADGQADGGVNDKGTAFGRRCHAGIGSRFGNDQGLAMLGDPS